eukprot:scaffold210128_cov17-Cyclotella_meneghiniana.AAC.1
MRRLLSTDGHGAASIPCAFDRRWPWLKRQVDRPSGGGAITRPPHNTLFSRGLPRKSRGASGIGKKQVPTDGE